MRWPRSRRRCSWLIVRLPVAASADQAASTAARISAPPSSMREPSSAAPSATDDRLANSTSDSITSAVVWAASREAPYCRPRLPPGSPAPAPAPAQPPAGKRGIGRDGPACRPPGGHRRRPASRRRRTWPARAIRRHVVQPAQHDVGHREAEAAHQRQPVGWLRGMGQPLPGVLDHDHDAGHGQRQPRSGPPCRPFAEQQPGQQHRPGRHQVEQQHDADHVADGHGPIEADVGQARSERQQPQQRLARPAAPGAAAARRRCRPAR
jgi:hypothetical protein